MKIQKNILFTIIVLISTSFTFAQFSHVGLKGGLNLSALDTDNEIELSGYENPYKVGLNIGVFTEFDLSKNMSVSAEVLYSQRGMLTEIKPNTEASEHFPEGIFTLNLDYIDIPILFNYMFISESNFTPRIFGGPFASFLLSAESAFEGPNDNEELDMKEFYKPNEFGLVFGLGTTYKINSGELIFDVRFMKGLSDIADFEGWSKTTSRNISVNLGYGFKL